MDPRPSCDDDPLSMHGQLSSRGANMPTLHPVYRTIVMLSAMGWLISNSRRFGRKASLRQAHHLRAVRLSSGRRCRRFLMNWAWLVRWWACITTFWSLAAGLILPNQCGRTPSGGKRRSISSIFAILLAVGKRSVIGLGTAAMRLALRRHTGSS